MVKVSKRFTERAKSHLKRYQRALAAAHQRDVNESDTSMIVSDMLADILGYDKFGEITTEFAIRSTFCDLAIKLDGHVEYLIEVKSIGTDLKDNHVKQAVDYGANQGIEWVLLTNGAKWQAFRLRFEKPISHDEVFSLDLLDPSAKPNDLIEKLYLISREAAGSTALGSYWKRTQATSRYMVAQVLLDGSTLSIIRRNLRRIFPGLGITEEVIEDLLRNEVLKREVLDGERAAAAEKLVKKAAKKQERAKAASSAPAVRAPTVAESLPVAHPPKPIVSS